MPATIAADHVGGVLDAPDQRVGALIGVEVQLTVADSARLLRESGRGPGERERRSAADHE